MPIKLKKKCFTSQKFRIKMDIERNNHHKMKPKSCHGQAYLDLRSVQLF